MKSSYLTNLVLLIIVITLLWFSQREPTTSQTDTKISNLTAEDIHSIQIQRPNGTIIIERQQGQWILTEPFKARANTTRTKLLLSLLSSHVSGQFQPLDQASLNQFGLAEPESQLLLNGERFLFGSLESLSQQRYVWHNDMIYLIEDTIPPLLKASAGSFVDNRLINENKTLTQLSLPINTNSQPLKISLNQGHWQSDNQSISSDSLKALVDSWHHAYAMQVHHIDSDALQQLPAAEIQLWFKDETSPMQLVLVESEQSLQLINPELQLQYDFPLALKTQLLPQPDTE
jgi:hypothetical protein